VETIGQASSHISKEVMEISTRILGCPEPKALETLKDDLHKSIVLKAIAYSKMLRRQRSWISLVLPAHETVVLRNVKLEKDLPQTPAGTQETTPLRPLGHTTIFICPALCRWTTVMGDEADPVSLVDAQEHQILVYLNESTHSRREQSLSPSERGLTSERGLQSERGIQSKRDLPLQRDDHEECSTLSQVSSAPIRRSSTSTSNPHSRSWIRRKGQTTR
jgi:hypothetical protein